jgi:hypothetical protein
MMHLKRLLTWIRTRLGLPPNAERRGTKNQPARKQNEKYAEKQESVADQLPALIKRGESLITEITAAREAQESGQTLESKRNRRPLWGAFIITVIYAFFAGAQWYTMKQQMEVANRPWLSAEVQILSPLLFDKNGDGRMTVSYVIENSGHSPAMKVFDRIRFIPAGLKRDQTEGGKSFDPILEIDRICAEIDEGARNPITTGYTMFPNKPSNRIQTLELHAQDIKEAISYMKIDQIVPMIVGCVDYGFSFEKGRHQSQFGFIVSQFDSATPMAEFGIPITGEIPISNLRLSSSIPNKAN